MLFPQLALLVVVMFMSLQVFLVALSLSLCRPSPGCLFLLRSSHIVVSFSNVIFWVHKWFGRHSCRLQVVPIFPKE